MRNRFLCLFSAFLLLSVALYSQTPGTLKWGSFISAWGQAGSSIVCSPAIGSDGSIYVIGQTDGILYAFNADGTKKWEYSTDLHMPIYSSSPAIAIDGTIYVNAQYEGKLYAINPNGTKKWDYLIGSFSVSTPSISADGTIYIGTLDFRLFAINPDGTKKWEYLSPGMVYTPAIGSDGTICFCASNNQLCAVNPDGTKKWEYLFLGVGESSPAISSDGTIYVGCPNYNQLYAVNPDGTKKWEFITGDRIYSSPAIGVDATIYIGSDDTKLYAINPDGTKKWEFFTGSRVNTNPAIGVDGTIYFGSSDSCLYAINSNGTLKWKYLSGGSVYSSPSVTKDGTVYFGSNSSTLYAIYSSSNGLANSPWPKFQHDNFNRGQFTDLTVINADFSNMALPNQTYNFKINLFSSFHSNMTITDVQINDTDFGFLTSIPITIIPGSQQEVSLALATPQNKWYKPTLSIDYSVEGTNYTKAFNLEGIIFLDDNTELAHTANLVMPVWKTLDKHNEILLNNTKGVIYRLLSDYSTAENFFNIALDTAINARYGYAGIMMNTGVVKSDRLIPDSADVFYNNAMADIQTTAASSVLAPQIYYNKAWEAYINTNYTDAAALALQTIDHSMANDYLKAKAYTLLGVIRYAQEKVSEAGDAFNQAVTLDKEGPIGKMAQANLDEIIGTGVDQNTVGPEIKLYPNPGDGKIRISTGNLTGNYIVSVFNNTGEMVFSTQFSSSAYSSQNLDLSHLSAGVYFISIKSDNSVFTDKIVIIRE
jgi:outer membrane protein assembly factor BamB